MRSRFGASAREARCLDRDGRRHDVMYARCALRDAPNRFADALVELGVQRGVVVGGDHQHAMRLDPRDLVWIAEPRVGDICRHAPVPHRERFADLPTA